MGFITMTKDEFKAYLNHAAQHGHTIGMDRQELSFPDFLAKCEKNKDKIGSKYGAIHNAFLNELPEPEPRLIDLDKLYELMTEIQGK